MENSENEAETIVETNLGGVTEQSVIKRDNSGSVTPQPLEKTRVSDEKPNFSAKTHFEEVKIQEENDFSLKDYPNFTTLNPLE